MQKAIDFLNRLNELTEETGIVIEMFHDHFYDPKLQIPDLDMEEMLFFSYDKERRTYVGRIGNPYDGDIFFPESEGET